MIFIKETYTIIRIKRMILIISLLLNILIIFISVFAAFKYYSSYYKKYKSKEELYPTDFEFQIINKDESGIIYAKEYDGIKCPHELINLFMGSIHEGFSYIDWSQDVYILKVSSNGKVINTSIIQKDTSGSNMNTNEEINSIQNNKKTGQTPKIQLAVSNINQIILPAH